MNDKPIRILFLSDTHLGFDLSFKPRVSRVRRGPDFFDNLNNALMPALDRKVDCVVHGGDLFYRSKVPQQLVDMAFEPLIRVAEKGIPLFLVPGNHERSNIPTGLFTHHPNIHIFKKPQTFMLNISRQHMSLSGFPYAANAVRR